MMILDLTNELSEIEGVLSLADRLLQAVIGGVAASAEWQTGPSTGFGRDLTIGNG